MKMQLNQRGKSLLILLVIGAIVALIIIAYFGMGQFLNNANQGRFNNSSKSIMPGQVPQNKTNQNGLTSNRTDDAQLDADVAGIDAKLSKLDNEVSKISISTQEPGGD